MTVVCLLVNCAYCMLELYFLILSIKTSIVVLIFLVGYPHQKSTLWDTQSVTLTYISPWIAYTVRPFSSIILE